MMRPNRRQFFRTAGAAALTLRAGSGESLAAEAGDDEGPVLRVGNDIAVAATQHGKVRGYALRGIHYVLGIPYGADTSGPNRFMPPRKPKAWTEVRPALWWGNSAPQDMERRYANPYASFRDHWNYDDVSEDCLRLNVFTPAIGDGRRRPVLVWLHGGGFANGNASSRTATTARTSPGSPTPSSAPSTTASARSATATCRASAGRGSPRQQRGHVGHRGRPRVGARQHRGLRRRPGNVTIIGQSGGGAKVCTLTAMPSAKDSSTRPWC